MTRRVRTESFDHTISGLLGKRADLVREALRHNPTTQKIDSGIQAIDRALAVLGFEGDADAWMPHRKREALFRRGELQRAVVCELRGAEAPLTRQQIAHAVLSARGGNTENRRVVSDMARRVGQVLRTLKKRRDVESLEKRQGLRMWKLK